MHSLQRKVLRTICLIRKASSRVSPISATSMNSTLQNNEFVDHRTGRFFMRTELEGILTTLLCWPISTAPCLKAPSAN